MTTTFHTAISTGAAANASTINTPLGALDAAIVDRVNATRSGATYEARGGVSWNATTKILSIPATSYILHGNSGKYLSFTSAVTLDFSSYTGNNIVYAYVVGVDPTAVQTAYSTSNIKIEAFSALTRNLSAPDVYVIAVYTSADNGIRSPFLEVKKALDLEKRWRSGAAYEARGGAFWDAPTYILTIPANSYIIHGSSGKYVSFTSAITLNFSSFVGSNNTIYAYVVGVDPTAVQAGYSTSNILVESFTALTRNLSDPDVYVIAVYTTASRQIRSPFLAPLAEETYNTAWQNLHPHVLNRLAGAAGKLLYPSDHVRVLLFGDSIFAREMHTSAGTIDPTALPPLLETRNVAWYLWQALRSTMPPAEYRRYDHSSGAYFSLTGTWATSTSGDNTANGGPNTAWDDSGDRPASTRISDSTNAAVTWAAGTSDNRSGINFIYRTDTAGEPNATITVVQGNGYLQYWNGSAWVEANGGTFSMLEATGTRRGNTIFQKRLYMRKTAANLNASITISVGKPSANSNRLLFWGVEFYDYKNGAYVPMLINSARGGHTINTSANNLYDYMDDDVIDQNPDLVIFEIPLINMLAAAGATVAAIRNSVHDTIWGDRSGATNTWNLKTQSSNWADFQVLAVLPHFVRAYYNSDGTRLAALGTATARQVYDAVKALFVEHNDVPFIDVSAAFEREIDAVQRWNGQYYTAMTASSASGLTLTSDNTHQNDRGTLIYAKQLAPLLAINTW